MKGFLGCYTLGVQNLVPGYPRVRYTSYIQVAGIDLLTDISFPERDPFHSLASQSSLTDFKNVIFLASQVSHLKHATFCMLKPGFFVVSTPTKHLAYSPPQSDPSRAEVRQALAPQDLAGREYIESLTVVAVSSSFFRFFASHTQLAESLA